MYLQWVGRCVRSIMRTRSSPIWAASRSSFWCGSLRNSSSKPSSYISSSVDGWMVSPRKSRKKSACFSSTTTSTPARRGATACPRGLFGIAVRGSIFMLGPVARGEPLRQRDSARLVTQRRETKHRQREEHHDQPGCEDQDKEHRDLGEPIRRRHLPVECLLQARSRWACQIPSVVGICD